jgi:hypothetical protein
MKFDGSPIPSEEVSVVSTLEYHLGILPPLNTLAEI